MRFLIIAPLMALLTGCEPVVQTRYITAELTRPERPVLPRVSGKELECLEQSTYQRLYDRQRLITGYAVKLEAIIDSTKKKEKQQ